MQSFLMKFSRGDKRGDGMMFWAYAGSDRREWWVSPAKFAEKKAHEKQKYERRKTTPPLSKADPKRRKRGDVSDDGLVFWGYHPTARGGEIWLSKEKFSKRRQWKADHNKKWNSENKARMNYLKRRWDKNNPEKLRAIWAKQRFSRRSLKKKNGGRVTKQELSKLMEKSRGKCYYCGRSGKLSYDHVVPLKLGGSNSIDNLVVACINCNSQKQAKDPLRYAREIGRLII